MNKKPEDMYADFVRNYEGYWISEYNKIIKEIMDDLDFLIYNETVSSSGKLFISKELTLELRKKWKEKL